MTKNELEQKIEELQKQLDELKSVKIEEMQKKWTPEVDDDAYYSIVSDGDICRYVFANDRFDKKCIELGNCFKTKEDAQFAADKIKYTQMFKQYVEEHSDPIDWRNEKQNKWCMYYDYAHNQIAYDWGISYKLQGAIYASSEQILQDAVAYVGEDNVKKYVFGVER